MEKTDDSLDVKLEECITDVEGLVDDIGDFFDDIRLDLKASVKSKIVGIRKYSILLRRRQSRLKERVTNYDLTKVRSIPVTGNLQDFFLKEIPIASDIDITEKVLNTTVEDFNIDILDILTDTNIDKIYNKLARPVSYFDNVGRQLILGKFLEVDDEFIEDVKANRLGFIVGSLDGMFLKGLVVDKSRQLVFTKSLKYTRTGVTPKVIPISLFKSTMESFLEHTDSETNLILGLYKRAIKETGKYIRRLKNEDGLTIGDAKIIVSGVIDYLEYVADSIFALTNRQFSFIYDCFDSLDIISGSSFTRIGV